jgi:hypothetical protein
MATATKADIEKIVRDILDEHDGAEAATLKAVQRVTKLLTEQVIPRLSNGVDNGAPDTGDDADEGENQTPLAARGGKPAPDDEDPGMPPDDWDEPATRPVPAAVTQAVEELYQGLSPDQADALAAVFTAMSGELEGGEEPEPLEPEDDDPTPSRRQRHFSRG